MSNVDCNTSARPPHRRGLSPRARVFPQSTIDNPQSTDAFTLVELIISIGLVLVIMLGVNYVFKMAGDTISAGQTLNENVRNSRASQAVLFEDFSRFDPNSPAILIKSRTQLAFRNQADQLGDGDYSENLNANDRATATASRDLDGDGLYDSFGEVTSAAQVNDRNHRVDVISFFARGQFTRQTGGDVGGGGVAANVEPRAPLMSTMTGSEAWIWYGHMALPDNNGTFTINNPPGAGTVKSNPGAAVARTNPNNFYASSWILGRMAVLLVEPYDNGSGDLEIRDRDGRAQVFISRSPDEITNANSESRTPLTNQSTAHFKVQPGSTVRRGVDPIEMLDSRFDLAGTSITSYRQILRNAIANGIANNTVDFNWWDNMMLDVRFETNPFVTRPINAVSYAQQAPIFVPGTSQFIVEFAGDFVQQDRDPNSATFGHVTAAFYDPTTARPYANLVGGTDGEIDFVVRWNDLDNDNVIDANERSSMRKEIRWYGLPRDTDGKVGILGYTNGRNANQMQDVVPLRDIVRTIGGPYANTQAPFEKPTPLFNTPTGTGPGGQAADYLNLAGGLQHDDQYICAWSPSDTVRPRMIRITMVVDDPSGRLGEGQTSEFVFNLPAGQ